MEAQEVMGLKIYPHKTDVNIAKASLVTGGGLSIAKKRICCCCKKTTSMATKTKAVAAAKVSNVSKKVTQGTSKIYTAVKFFIKPSDNGEKETSDKR